MRAKSRTGKRFIRQTRFVAALLLCLQPAAHARGLVNQSQGEVRQLETGRPVEREIAGGESHAYQISLAAGQFARFRLEQRAIDAALTLTAPDGKQLVEMNLTRAGDEESLSLEAAVNGDYRLTVRVGGLATLRGAYRLEAVAQAAATARDKERMSAESLMIESEKLVPQGGKAAPKIIENMQQALRIWREQNEPSWEAWSLFKIGNAHSDLSQQEKAIEYLGQGLSLYQAAKNRSGEGETLHRLGTAYMRLTQYEKAMEHYQRALVINREVKSRAGEGRTLVMMGQVQVHRGQYEKAIEYFAPAVGINQEVKDGRQQAVVLFSLGNAYIGLSKFEKAIETFEQALLISQEIKNRIFEAAAFANLGAAYTNTYRTEKGIEYVEQALAIYREYKERASELNMLINLGTNYMVVGRHEKAIGYLEEALPLAREIKNRWHEGRALEQLGIVYLHQRKFEKAIEFIEPAIAIFREVKVRFHEGSALRALGITYYELKQFEKASAYQEQALAISREINDRINVVSSLYHAARAENRRGDLARAQTLTEEGIKIAESLRAELGSTEFRSAFLANEDVQGSYRLYTDVLMRQHRAQPTKGFDALAVEAVERQRARSLLDLLSEANTNLHEGVDPALIQRERLLAKQLNDKARTQTGTPEQAAALKLEISQLENDYERAQVAIRKASPRYAALTRPQPLKLREIQAQLDPDTLLLEYALGEERSYLWAISKDSLKSYELPKGELIDKNAREVYAMLTARSTTKRGESALQRQERVGQAEAKLPAAARELSQTLLAPAAAELGDKRLVIVADGALQYVPFAMLPHPSAGKAEPLVVRHEVVSLPSASALAIQRAELAGRKPAPKLLAVIADPVFDRTDARFKTAAADTRDKEPAQAVGLDDARSIEHLAGISDDKAGAAARTLVIPRLPFTKQEAARLLAITPKNSSFGAIDFQANRETVLKGDLGQYRYVHFATHGLLDSERPGLSALVLSTVDERGRPRDGFLRANDIYNLRLPAELVVLSACQTGLGKDIKGEGLVGLTRGFMYAGAARVVVSLWSVNDRATSELMAKFYERMLRQGARPAAALRAAQVEMWRQKQWQSPYYWAAFTMQGEWR